MLPSNKQLQNSTNFQIHEDFVAMETKLCIYFKERNMSEGWYEYSVPLKHCYANVLWFLLKLCKYDLGGVDYRTSGILKFDKFWNQTTTVSIIWVQLVSVL